MTGWLRVLLTGWALALAACSSFDRDWRAERDRAVARKGDPFSGAWDGQWTSAKHRLPDGTAAGGRLRCIFTRLDGAHYRAAFRADWLAFSTGYEVTFQTHREGGALVFHGTQDLGAIFGGVYRYEGRVAGRNFHADFTASADHGTFAMIRAPRRLTP